VESRTLLKLAIGFGLAVVVVPTLVGIWMFVYLSLSLLTSLFMNWFNARMKLVER